MLSFLIGCLIFLTVIFGIGMNVGASLCNKHWAGRQMTNTVIGYKGTYYRVLTENQMIDLITPSWHRWGGLNDRFALCSLRGARIYATDRFKNLERRISLIGGLHPESLLHLSAREASLTLAFTGLRAARIRGNGRQQEENFQL